MTTPSVFCDGCGREVGSGLVRCSKRGAGDCPYVVKSEPLRAQRTAGLVILLAGALLLWATFYFPFMTVQGTHPGIVAITLRMTLISACLLGSMLALGIGVLLTFTKRTIIYSRKDLVAWEGYLVRGIELKMKLLSDVRPIGVKYVAPPVLRCPISIAALGDPQRVQTARRDAFDPAVPEEQRGAAGNSLQRIAAEVWGACLHWLMHKEFISVRRGEIYESSGKRLELSANKQKYLIFPGANHETPEGLLERRIVEVVRDWPQHQLSDEEPLAPSVPLLFKAALAAGEEPLAAALIDTVLGDGITSGIYRAGAQVDLAEEHVVVLAEDRGAAESFRQEARGRNPDAGRAFEGPVHELFEEREDASETLWQLSPKTVRVGAAVVLTVAVILWRLSSPLVKVSAVGELLSQLEAPEIAVRERALAALRDQQHQLKQASSDLQGRFYGSMRKLLHDPNRFLRIEALQSLMRMNSPQAKALLQQYKQQLKGLLRSGNAYARRGAAEALGVLGAEASDAVGDLLQALLDMDPLVRSSAAAALGNVGGSAADVVPALVSLLSDQNELTRSAAAYALANFGGAAAEAVPALIEALLDESPGVAAGAAYSLGRIGAPASVSVPALTRAVEQGEGKLRENALEALKRLGVK